MLMLEKGDDNTPLKEDCLYQLIPIGLWTRHL